MNIPHTPSSDLSVYFDAHQTFIDNRDKSMDQSSQDFPPPVPMTYQLVDEPVGMPVEEPAPVKEKWDEQHIQRQDNQIMQHPSGSEGWLPTEDVPPGQMPQPHHHSPVPATNVNGETSISSARIRDRDNLDATIAAKSSAAGTSTAGATAPAPAPAPVPVPVPAPAHRRAVSLGRSGSRRSAYATTDGRPIPGSAFVNGAGATGPFATAEEDEAIAARTQEAQANLTPKQRVKVAKIAGGLNGIHAMFLSALQFS